MSVTGVMGSNLPLVSGSQQTYNVNKRAKDKQHSNLN